MSVSEFAELNDLINESLLAGWRSAMVYLQQRDPSIHQMILPLDDSTILEIISSCLVDDVKNGTDKR